MSNWHNPNIIVVGVSPTYDPTKPTKSWVDTRAENPNNKELSFVYNKLVHGKMEQFSLLRQDAGVANIPPVDLVNASNTANWNPTVVPVPIRDLEIGEQIGSDPFGQILITKEADRALKLSDLAGLDTKLNKILSMLQVTGRA